MLDNSPPLRVILAQLHHHSVALQNAAHRVADGQGNVAQHFAAIFNLDLKQRTRQDFDDLCLKLPALFPVVAQLPTSGKNLGAVLGNGHRVFKVG